MRLTRALEIVCDLATENALSYMENEELPDLESEELQQIAKDQSDALSVCTALLECIKMIKDTRTRFHLISTME